LKQAGFQSSGPAYFFRKKKIKEPIKILETITSGKD
jgi:hypothetical protein